MVLFLVGYIVGPTAALDYVLQHRQDYTSGTNHTFKFFLAIFSRLGLVAYQPPPPDDFIFVPFPTNVLTVYRYFMTDFGLYGSLIVMAVIGLLQTLVYRKARTGSKLAMYFLPSPYLRQSWLFSVTSIRPLAPTLTHCYSRLFTFSCDLSRCVFSLN